MDRDIKAVKEARKLSRQLATTEGSSNSTTTPGVTMDDVYDCDYYAGSCECLRVSGSFWHSENQT
jgi:hypothetical protein